MRLTFIILGSITDTPQTLCSQFKAEQGCKEGVFLQIQLCKQQRLPSLTSSPSLLLGLAALRLVQQSGWGERALIHVGQNQPGELSLFKPHYPILALFAWSQGRTVTQGVVLQQYSGSDNLQQKDGNREGPSRLNFPEVHTSRGCSGWTFVYSYVDLKNQVLHWPSLFLVQNCE